MAQVEFKAVTKFFGKALAEAAHLRADGKDKAEIRAATGCTLALDTVSLAIERGEIFVVMGLSGSGKSTLVRLVNRLIEPTSGDVTVAGRSVPAMDARALARLRRFQVSMVFQHFSLFPHKTVMRNVAYGLEVRGEDKSHARNTAADWVARVGLDGYETAYPAELSGGMQQRVGLARALATDPEILLMDEPFSALDPLIRADMQDQLLELQRQLAKTVLFITHDLGEALRLGDRIAILRDGQVVQCGTGRQILSAPADDYVRAFVRALDRSRPDTATFPQPK